MQREVAEIIATKMRDPRLSHWVSVTDVVVTNDLSSARIYVSILSTGEERELTLKTLQSAANFVRHELAPKLGLREVPELRFAYDESIERGARVEDLLRRIHEGEPIEDDEEEA